MSYEERLEAAVRKQQEHEELKTLLDVRDVQLLTEVARLFVPMLDPLDLRAFLNRAFDGDSAPSAPVPSEDFPLREKPSPGTLEDDLSILVGTIRDVLPEGSERARLLTNMRTAFAKALKTATARPSRWPKAYRLEMSQRVYELLEVARPPQDHDLSRSVHGGRTEGRLTEMERRLAAAIICEVYGADRARPSADEHTAEETRLRRMRRRLPKEQLKVTDKVARGN